jgi:hypothetical protein
MAFSSDPSHLPRSPPSETVDFLSKAAGDDERVAVATAAQRRAERPVRASLPLPTRIAQPHLPVLSSETGLDLSMESRVRPAARVCLCRSYRASAGLAVAP